MIMAISNSDHQRERARERERERERETIRRYDGMQFHEESTLDIDIPGILRQMKLKERRLRICLNKMYSIK
jgi:cephalosporin hydroxylase